MTSCTHETRSLGIRKGSDYITFRDCRNSRVILVSIHGFYNAPPSFGRNQRIRNQSLTTDNFCGPRIPDRIGIYQFWFLWREDNRRRKALGADENQTTNSTQDPGVGPGHITSRLPYNQSERALYDQIP